MNPNGHLCKISSDCFIIYETTSRVLVNLRVGVENKPLEIGGWRRANDISWKWETNCHNNKNNLFLCRLQYKLEFYYPEMKVILGNILHGSLQACFMERLQKEDK